MDPSRALLALDELAKWKERKRRAEERLRQVRVRKEFLARELASVRARIAELNRFLVPPRTGPLPTADPPSTTVTVIR